jgi:malate dehydrogenase (oxaloacetate-decarboxylating)(NADP+)
MGIPIGKLSLYIACAGFYPGHTLPVCLDVGTNTESLLQDPLYLGQNHKRVDGPEYFSMIDEFVTAVKGRWPNVLVQWEDFSNDHAFDILEKHREKV